MIRGVYVSSDSDHRIDANNVQEHELYVKALKALDGAGRISEYHKAPETLKELDLARSSHVAVTRNTFTMPYYGTQYEDIFRRPESDTGRVDHEIK